MSRWRKPTKDEIRAKRAEIAAHARLGQLKLPDAIAEMRRSLGMSQAEFSKLFRITRRQVAEIEQGDANPTMETLNRIGKAFGFCVGFVPLVNKSRAQPIGVESEPAFAEPDNEVSGPRKR
jgi:putative transcriptional regulator